jgi:hypothetical protein
VDKGVVLLKDGGFNHYRVAQVLLSALSAAAVPGPCLTQFENLFARLNSVLGNQGGR